MIDLGVLLWVAIAAAVIVACVLALWPYLKPAAVEEDDPAAPAMHIYRDQLAEIERDLKWGRISENEAEGMRTEVKRRMLRQAGGGADGDGQSEMNAAVVYISVVIVVASAVGMYGLLGSPQLASLAPEDSMDSALGLAPAENHDSDSAAGAGQGAGAPSMDAMIAKLTAHLEENPQDVRGWGLLGRSLLRVNEPGRAAEAFARAIELEPDNIDHYIAQGESLMNLMGGRITPAAQLAFTEAARIDPQHAAPQFYAGLSYLQAGDPAGAADIWRAMLANAPADAPWRSGVEAQVRRAEAMLSPDQRPETGQSAGVMPVPDAAAQQMAAEMSDEERTAFIESMVARLASRLEESPDDVDGWIRLARAYQILERTADAREALDRALAAAPEARKAEIESLISGME